MSLVKYSNQLEQIDTANKAYLLGVFYSDGCISGKKEKGWSSSVASKDHLSDKTKWRQMLHNKRDEVDIIALAQEMRQYLPDEVQEYINNEPELWQIDFPVIQYPEKIKSLNLEKNPVYEGVLSGIKGQYLLFEDQTVFNVRNSEGYVTSWDISIKKST